MIKGIEELDLADVSVVRITPDAAAKLLSTNYGGQRSIKGTNVEKLVEVMKAGKWNPYVGDLIRITRDGVLVDGQHRLLAVIESGVTCEFLLAENFDIGDFPYIDTGASRIAKDVVGADFDPSAVAALVRVVITWEQDGLDCWDLFTRSHSNGAIADRFKEMDSEEVRDVIAKSRGVKKGLGVKGSTLAVCFFSYLANMVDPAIFDRFVESSCDDAKMVVARTFFLRAAAANRNLIAKDVFSVLCTIWNDGLSGNERKALRPNTKRLAMFGVNKRWNNIWLEESIKL